MNVYLLFKFFFYKNNYRHSRFKVKLAFLFSNIFMETQDISSAKGKTFVSKKDYKAKIDNILCIMIFSPQILGFWIFIDIMTI